MSEFIAALVKDPKNPPEVVEITGFLGAAGEPGRTRIYLDTTLQNYVEVMEDKILHVEPVEGGQLGLSLIFIAADAQVFPPEQAPRLDARTVFGGAVYQDYLNVPPGAAIGPTGADVGVGTNIRITILQLYCPTQYYFNCPTRYILHCPTRYIRCTLPPYCLQPETTTPACYWRQTRDLSPACSIHPLICVGGQLPYAGMAQPEGGGRAGVGAVGQQQAAFPFTIPYWRCQSYLYPCITRYYICTRYPYWRCGPLPQEQIGGPVQSIGACPTAACGQGGGFIPPEWGGMGGWDPGTGFGGGYDPYAPYQQGY
jgi:hypothetical protein